jgi:hypothetical protein
MTTPPPRPRENRYPASPGARPVPTLVQHSSSTHAAPRADLYALPRIPYLRLRFTLRSLGQAQLPRYKGSLLRGAFGHALRKAVCAMAPDQPCETCPLRRPCVYTRLFETFIEDEPPPFLRGLPTSPRPYIFEPRCDERHLLPGAELEFDLLLIGQAIELQPYALLAVERMATTGLGRDRHRFTLDRAQALDPTGGRDPFGATAGPVPNLAPTALLPPLPDTSEAPSRAVLHFLTPTRIKTRDHLSASITLRPLVFAMLRRTLELAHFHVPGAPIDWTFRPLLDHATSLHLLATDLHWYDWQRYSNRQQTKINLGGFVGTLELEGDLAPLWPLLRTAEILHVGKGATFGLGKLELAASP